MLNRRDTLGLLGMGEATYAATPWILAESGETQPLPAEQLWLTRLADGIPDRIDSAPTVEGTLPPDLSGTLYRDGPGLFERNGYRKSTLLDGDGMIRAFSFAGGKVRFRTVWPHGLCGRTGLRAAAGLAEGRRRLASL